MIREIGHQHRSDVLLHDLIRFLDSRAECQEEYTSTTTSVVDMIVGLRYAASLCPIFPGGRACSQPVGRKAKVFLCLHLTWSPAMWKDLWKSSGSFSRPFTTVSRGASRAPISLTIWSANSVSWNASQLSRSPSG